MVDQMFSKGHGEHASVNTIDRNDTTAADGDSLAPTVSAFRSMSEPRLSKFAAILSEPIVDLLALKELAWSGIPPSVRPTCWRLLLGYSPPNRERRDAVLDRKRREYRELIPEYYDSAVDGTYRSTEEESALRQVSLDVPRTAPGVPFFHQKRIQKCLERILYIWGVRHPASGYVQGINDLATPFLAVFVGERVGQHAGTRMEHWDLDAVEDTEVRLRVLLVDVACHDSSSILFRLKVASTLKELL